MDKYINAKRLTDQKLQDLDAHVLGIRERGQKLIERHLNLLRRQRNFTQRHDESEIKGSDEMYLNVGGTEKYFLREMLTQIKGSRLELLFNGRWDDQLLRDEKGRIFLDLDVCYFEKIIEHLNSMNLDKDCGFNDEVLNWPTLFNDKDKQRTLDLYIDLFRLRRVDKEENTYPSIVKPKNNLNEGADPFEDVCNFIKNERHELDEAEKNLDQMEKELEEEEEFVSFFTTNLVQSSQVQTHEKEYEFENNDALSITSTILDLPDVDSITISSKHEQTHDISKSPIINLWVEGEIISVKHSTLCVCEGSPLAKKFNDPVWVKNCSQTNEDGKRLILTEYSSAFVFIINQLRLRSMMVATDKLPTMETKKVESLNNIASQLFAGKEDFILGEINLDSLIITSQSQYNQVVTWFEEVNRRCEPKLLYRASCHGWGNDFFHIQCNTYSNTFVVVKTSEGYIFGGYSDQSWEGNNEYRSSSDSFLFSLKCHADLPPVKMKIKSGHEGQAVYCHSACGPTFGCGSDIYIDTNLGMKGGYTNLNTTYEIPYGVSNTFLTGKTGSDKLFDVAEIEVFEV